LSPLLQSIAIMLLLILLFLFPVLSRLLPVLLMPGNSAALWFPPFWFLGIYERLLAGRDALPIFVRLSQVGFWATAVAVGVTILTYPLAYRRKMRGVVEGTPARRTGSRVAQPVNRLLHRTFLRSPGRRAIYHFISQSLPRLERHRLYLAMYAGLGLSLVVSGVVALRSTQHHTALVLSAYGLRCSVPVVAFWTISGLRTSLTSVMDRRGSWIFRVIDGRAQPDHLAAARLWALFQSAAFTALAIAILWALKPAEVAGPKAVAAQCIVGFGLCIVLVDLFFANVLTAPFTAPRAASSVHLTFLIPAYLILFPTLVWASVAAERWLESSALRLALAIAVIAATDALLRWFHQRRYDEEACLLPVEDEEAWPPRLGLE
jgi:hypothetical protein